MPDVRMPDGTIIRNVPEGTTRSELERRMKAKAPVQAPRKSAFEQLDDSVGNVIGGVLEGAVGTPDALWDAATGTRRVVNRAVGSLGEKGLRAVGADRAADWWKRGSDGVEGDLGHMARPSTPITNNTPAPPTTAGRVARFGAQLAGGAAIPIGPSLKNAPRLSQAKAPPRGIDANVIRAGRRQNIPVRRPDAVAAARGDMAHAKSAPYSGPIVSRALDADKEAIQARIASLGGGGNVQPEAYNLGQQIQKVGTDFIAKSGKNLKRAYEQVHKLANGRRVSPKDAIAEVDRNIAELQAQGGFTNGATIDYLRGLRSDLAKSDGFSVPEFQGLRSAARKKISGSQELTATDAERRLGSVVKAFSGDARAQLPRDAASLLDETDAAYAQRMDFIKGVLQKHVLGRKNSPLSAEATARNVSAMAKNRADYDTFTRLWEKTDPETRADFTATFANNLGAGRNGEFGLGRLATDIEQVPRNIQQTMFGQEGAQSLDDLRTLALAKSGTAQGLNNSKTGDVVLRQVVPRIGAAALGGGVIGGPLGMAAAPMLTEGVAAASQLLKARSLLNPNFEKVLASQAVPSMDDVTAPFVSRLPGMTANPAVRDQYGLLADLLNMPAQGVRAAAGDREEDKRKKYR